MSAQQVGFYAYLMPHTGEENVSQPQPQLQPQPQNAYLMIVDRSDKKVKQKKKGKEFPYTIVSNAFAKQQMEELPLWDI